MKLTDARSSRTLVATALVLLALLAITVYAQYLFRGAAATDDPAPLSQPSMPIDRSTPLSKKTNPTQPKRSLLAPAAGVHPTRSEGSLAVDSAMSHEDEEELSLDPMLIQSILQEVKLDEEQAIVLDDEARRRLDKSVLMLGQDIDQMTLDLLEQLITTGLPGAAGEQAADIFRRYYEYKSAESDLVALAEMNGAGSERETLEQLIQLRQSYLGHETASKLFAEEENYLRYTLAIMENQEDQSLTDREKATHQHSIQQQYYPQ